ncbi:MAG: 30S ribosomal protein S6 [Opitutales bacterium]
MIATTSTKSYRATFILDLRNSEDDAQKVLADLSEILGSVGAEDIESEDHGLREFARAADKGFQRGHYLEFAFSAPPTAPAALKEKLRLDDRINRIFIEAV